MNAMWKRETRGMSFVNGAIEYESRKKRSAQRINTTELLGTGELFISRRTSKTTIFQRTKEVWNKKKGNMIRLTPLVNGWICLRLKRFYDGREDTSSGTIILPLK